MTTGTRHRNSGVLLGLAAAILWIAYAITQKAFWMRGDEISFAHEFWLQKAGLVQYDDYSSHFFPTYFKVFGPIASALTPTDNALGFVYGLKIANLAFFAAYIAILWDIARSLERHFQIAPARLLFIALLPALMLFIVFGRMVEIRPDTVSLLLVNIFWWGLFRHELARKQGSGSAFWLIVSGLAILTAGLFAARALVILALVTPIFFYVMFSTRDGRIIKPVLMVAAAILLVMASIYLFVARELVHTAIENGIFKPGGLAPRSLAVKLAHPLRGGLLVALMGLAVLICLLRILRPRYGRRLFTLILAAIAAQLGLLLIDPAPYGYAYGYALMPTLFCLPFLGDAWTRPDTETAGWKPLAGYAAMALLLLGSIAAFGILRTTTAPQKAIPGVLRLLPDRTITQETLSEAGVPELAAMLAEQRYDQNLFNQIQVREALCARVEGPVLSIFAGHPICKRDALYDWMQVYWPVTVYETTPNMMHLENSISEDAFTGALSDIRPGLIFWSFVKADGNEVNPPSAWLKDVLSEHYAVYQGFALRRTKDGSVN